MRINKGFVLRNVYGQSVIVGEGLEAANFGKMIPLNESATVIWEQAEALGDFNVEQLATRLCEEYEVTMEKARQDVAKILNEWQNIGIISE